MRSKREITQKASPLLFEIILLVYHPDVATSLINTVLQAMCMLHDINSNSGCFVCLGLSGTERRPDKVEGSVCFKYKYRYVFTTNTKAGRARFGYCYKKMLSPPPTHLEKVFGSVTST